MRPILLCAAFACLAACASPRESGDRPAASSQAAQTQMWAEPAGLFLVGLEHGKATLALADFRVAEDAMWRSADADGDGFVRTIELQAWRRTWFGSDDGWPGLFHFDKNSDGMIDKSEFKAGLETIFEKFDKNHDGTIDRSELLTEHSAESRRFGHEGPGREGGEGQGPSERPKQDGQPGQPPAQPGHD